MACPSNHSNQRVLKPVKAGQVDSDIAPGAPSKIDEQSNYQAAA